MLPPDTVLRRMRWIDPARCERMVRHVLDVDAGLRALEVAGSTLEVDFVPAAAVSVCTPTACGVRRSSKLCGAWWLCGRGCVACECDALSDAMVQLRAGGDCRARRVA